MMANNIFINNTIISNNITIINIFNLNFYIKIDKYTYYQPISRLINKQSRKITINYFEILKIERKQKRIKKKINYFVRTEEKTPKNLSLRRH